MTKEEFFSSGIIRPKSRGRSAVHEHNDIKLFLPLTRDGKAPDVINLNIYNAKKMGVDSNFGIILKFDEQKERIYLIFEPFHYGESYKIQRRKGSDFYNATVKNEPLLRKVTELGGTIRANVKFDADFDWCDGFWFIQLPTKETKRSRKYDPSFYDFS